MKILQEYVFTNNLQSYMTSISLVRNNVKILIIFIAVYVISILVNWIMITAYSCIMNACVYFHGRLYDLQTRILNNDNCIFLQYSCICCMHILVSWRMTQLLWSVWRIRGVFAYKLCKHPVTMITAYSYSPVQIYSLLKSCM